MIDGCETASVIPGRVRTAQALTNQQLAGQRVISSYPGLTPPASLLSDVAAGNTAGVIFFGHLAPVLDVFYKSGNFIDQFQRSYSSDPTAVSECGQAFITAQQATGVAATAKHFPGLGSAAKNQNTDSGPVTLTVSLTKLHTIDEVPVPGRRRRRGQARDGVLGGVPGP